MNTSTSPVRRPALPGNLAETIRPVTMSGQQILPVGSDLTELFPDKGLRRGTTVVIDGAGATSLALNLASGASRAGSWCATVAMGDLNPQALDYAGLDLSTVVFVPATGSHWGEIVTALVTDFDVVIARPTGPVGASVTRHLGAKVRLHRSVLIVVSPVGRWAEVPDIHLAIGSSRWEGTDNGAGHLAKRSIDVVVSGRRASSRASARHLVLNRSRPLPFV